MRSNQEPREAGFYGDVISIVAAKPKPKKKKKSKKDAQLVLRLNSELRDRFVDTCQELDTTAAREVRRFIKRFLKRYENGEFDE